MGSYGKIRCVVCGSQIDILERPRYCPACKSYIYDKLNQAGLGTGIKYVGGMNTARVIGPDGIEPKSDS